MVIVEYLAIGYVRYVRVWFGCRWRYYAEFVVELGESWEVLSRTGNGREEGDERWGGETFDVWREWPDWCWLVRVQASFDVRVLFDCLVDLAVWGIGTCEGREWYQLLWTWWQMSCMFFIHSLSFAVLKFIVPFVEFGSDAPRSCVCYHNFPDTAFAAVRSDRSSSKHKVVDFVDERVGSTAVDIFAVPSAMLMD
jgi:hypothetical protein